MSEPPPSPNSTPPLLTPQQQQQRSGGRSRQLLGRALGELGLTPVYAAPRDVKVLFVQRFVRMFAYGASTLVLVAYLTGLGIPRTGVGLFMTLTLAGDVCVSFVLTLFADALGRRAVLALGAVLMAASGAVFATSGSYWVLLAAAVVGVISPRWVDSKTYVVVEVEFVGDMLT